MNFVDYALIAIVIVSVVIGALRGFMREAVAFASWIIGLFVAWHFASSLEPHLGAWLAQHPDLRIWVARAILLFVVLLLGAVAAGLLAHFVRLSIFSGLDRFLGIVFGALRGVVVVGVLVILGQLMRMDAEAWWSNSVLIPQATSIADMLRAFVGDHWPPSETSVKV
jgi:membrane protein required for colicin V production